MPTGKPPRPIVLTFMALIIDIYGYVKDSVRGLLLACGLAPDNVVQTEVRCICSRCHNLTEYQAR